MRDDSWRDEAACATMDVETFFPSRRSATDAIAVCRWCPVRFPCLDSALFEERSTHRDELAGVRGGLTAAERYRLRLLFYGRTRDRVAV